MSPKSQAGKKQCRLLARPGYDKRITFRWYKADMESAGSLGKECLYHSLNGQEVKMSGSC